jgi:hypothetical protein
MFYGGDNGFISLKQSFADKCVPKYNLGTREMTDYFCAAISSSK